MLSMGCPLFSPKILEIDPGGTLKRSLPLLFFGELLCLSVLLFLCCYFRTRVAGTRVVAVSFQRFPSFSPRQIPMKKFAFLVS